MSLTEVLLDSRMFLLAALPVVAVMFVGAWVGTFPAAALRRVAHLESALLPFIAGLAWGPQWLGNLIAYFRGGDLSLTWDSIIGLIILLVALLAFVFSVRNLTRLENYKWIAAAIITYNLGTWMHVILRRGEPFTSWFGGAA